MSLPAAVHSIRCNGCHGLLKRGLVTRYAAREASAYVPHQVLDAQHVPLPMCRRQASHVELLSTLMSWRQDVLQQIMDIRDAFESTDGGPSASALQREVTWTLDDIVAAWREQEQQQWQPCSWQQLDLELQSAVRRSRPTGDWQVQLRTPVQQLQQLWQLRLQDRVPFQYLIHTAHWRDLVLSVGPGILVPRPETEIMIDLAAAAVSANPALASAPWVDLGTGSGAIAISAAKLLQKTTPQPRVWAVDLSTTAVAYATANAAACGVQGVVNVVQGSWFEPLEQQQLQGQLGCVLSNPPYIPRVQMDGLQAEVGRHEPWSALDGGPQEGTDSLQVICGKVAHMLAPGGFLALETAGGEQAYLVQWLLQQLEAKDTHVLAFVDVVVHDDCYGVPRFVSATRTT